MNDLLLYILKSTLCLSLLYLAFRTVMRKETFFALNRMVLLTILCFSMIVPLLYLPTLVVPIIQDQIFIGIQFSESKVLDLSTVEGESNNIFSTIWHLYLAGMLVNFLIFCHSILSILLLLRKAEIKHNESYRIIILEKEISAFTFGKYVFISRIDYNEHGATILAHEEQHIDLKHFYDLLLIELVKIIHWFNPFVYWLIEDLKAIHEFQADEQTLTKGIDATKYQILIIKKSVGPQRFALANSFNHCQIKKRITMMNKSKTGKAWRWKVATFLPLLALLLMAFGRTGENVPLSIQNQKTILNQGNAIGKTVNAEDKVYYEVEFMPEFPGGDEALRDFIIKNFVYPKNASKKGIQGKVFVGFIVTKEGKVTNAKIIRGVDPELDAEALRLIQLMPTWKPGKDKGVIVNVAYTIPINFALK